MVTVNKQIISDKEKEAKRNHPGQKCLKKSNFTQVNVSDQAGLPVEI
jgi:hypothetical protein